MFEVRFGVPGLGIIIEFYNFNKQADREAFDKNVANGCMVLHMKLVNRGLVI